MSIYQAETVASEAEAEVAAMHLAKLATEVLHKHYPGHLWAVTVRVDGGIMEVRNMLLSGLWGFVLHLRDLDPDMKKVMRAGGELLERYKLQRGRYKEGTAPTIRRSFNGNLVADHG